MADTTSGTPVLHPPGAANDECRMTSDEWKSASGPVRNSSSIARNSSIERNDHSGSSAAAAALDPRTVYDAYRRQIEHEDNLIGQRSSWLLMAESFLVVGYCILHQLAPPDPAVQPVTGLLTTLIGWLGLLTAAPILLSVLAAGEVMRNLRAELAARRAAWPALDAYMAEMPAIQPEGLRLFVGRIPAVALPAVLCGFWLKMIVMSAIYQ